METAARITAALAKGRFDKEIATEEVRAVLAAEVERVLAPVAKPLRIEGDHKPHVILVIGVNGTGKTTTIGKLAHRLAAEGSTVMLAAGDTFRAAAIEQLKIWGARTGAEVVARETGADAAGLAFDALKQAREKERDVLLIDTAGRLQNKQALMDELEKVIRVLRKLDPSAPHQVLLVLDATTGQNALNQVEIFKDKAGVTGLVMTKLDGTAQGRYSGRNFGKVRPSCPCDWDRRGGRRPCRIRCRRVCARHRTELNIPQGGAGSRKSRLRKKTWQSKQ